MLVKNVMSRGMGVVYGNTSVQEAARMMLTLESGPVPVLEQEQLAGMLNERDLLKVAIDGRDPAAVKVREIMSSELIFCYEDQNLEAAVRLMRERQIQRLMVLTRDKRLVGTVALKDLLLENIAEAVVS